MTGANTGGADITAYQLWWDNNNDGTYVLFHTTADAATLTYIESSVTQGVNYKVKYLAVNAHGDGELSDEVSILAASVPVAIGVPNVSHSGTDAQITWSVTSDSRGSDVESYLI